MKRADCQSCGATAKFDLLKMRCRNRWCDLHDWEPRLADLKQEANETYLRLWMGLLDQIETLRRMVRALAARRSNTPHPEAERVKERADACKENCKRLWLELQAEGCR